MARIFTDGGEMGDVLFWTGATLTYCVTATPTPFASTFCYKINNSNSANAYKIITPLSEAYMRTRIYFSGTQGNVAAHRIFALKSDSSLQPYITFESDAIFHYILKSGGGITLVDSGIPILFNTWMLFEMYVKIADSGGRVVFRIDGTNVIDFTGDTKEGSPTTFNTVLFNASDNCYYGLDDLALNDTTGTVDNSWCGEGILGKIIPSGSGTVNNWLNSGSTSGSSNYEYVDEYPKDGDTTYVYVSASSTGIQDKYTMSTFTGTEKSILRIYSESRARKSIADTSVIKIGYLPNGGTDQLSGSIPLSSASYTYAAGISASANPVTGLAWTLDDINALQYVIQSGE